MAGSIADGIDAIENPTELPGALVENGVEAVAVPWIKDFLRIGGADSGNPGWRIRSRLS